MTTLIPRTILILAASLLAAPVRAQAPQSPNASFEAALKQTCPAKNLEFLKPDVLAHETDGFVDGLPAGQAKKVRDLAKRGVDACSGSADDSCRTAAILGSVRYLDLSLPLARKVCALPVTCRDWFECSSETGPEQRTAEQSPPSVTPPAPGSSPVPATPDDGTVQKAPAPAAPTASPPPEPPRQQEAAAPPPPPPPPRPASQAQRPTEPREARGADASVEEEVAGDERTEGRPPEAQDGRAVVERFYRALGRGDGIDAAHYLIPEKRGRGPFSASAMQRFYGGLRRPLRLESAQRIGPTTVRARYAFVARDGSACNGDAIVALRPGPDGPLIESIRALSGC